MESTEPRKTALNAIHRQLGGRMVSFAGWDMPVQYAGPIPEHMAVRTRAGIFDVSHMGEIEIKGQGALDSLQWVTCNDAARLRVGQIQYSALTDPNGCFVDDILVHRMADDRFFLCVNASNQEKDYAWIRDNARPGTEVIFRSDEFSQMAVQGPMALEILQSHTSIDLSAIRYYWFTTGRFAGFDAIVARTGYTGEDGFEIYVRPGDAQSVWLAVMESGQGRGLQPAGLAARNTLRLEAKMALYGHEIDHTTTVLEADLGWICKLGKGPFIGSEVLERQSREGVSRILAGFEMTGRGIARDGYAVSLGGRVTGKVTSGSPAPFLRKNIGMTYLPPARNGPGTELEITIRDRPVPAVVVPTPFYKRHGKA